METLQLPFDRLKTASIGFTANMLSHPLGHFRSPSPEQALALLTAGTATVLYRYTQQTNFPVEIRNADGTRDVVEICIGPSTKFEEIVVEFPQDAGEFTEIRDGTPVTPKPSNSRRETKR